ncbi:MAG: aldehyde dehydrogenase family protein [Candidatus Eremiobacterota bacterium]
MLEFENFINGTYVDSSVKLDVINPYSGEVAGKVSQAGYEELEEAIACASSSFNLTKKLPVYKKVEILKYIARRIKEEKEDFAKLITLEAGKPIKDSRVEVDRAVNTFNLASEEVSRVNGEYFPLDIIPASAGRKAITGRFPRGPVAAISPFNFPLNLVAHKVAPAIAAGNSVIMKPSSQTPMTALKLAGIIGETDFPKGAVNALCCPSRIAEKLASDHRVKVLSFTGSPPVGWHLKSLATKKQVTLELGGNAGVIVHNDSDVDFAVKRCVTGSFSFSGQVCISVQRIFVQNKIFQTFLDKFIEETKKLKTGDPFDENTDIGPLVNSAGKDKAMSFIEDALSGGARLLLGGKPTGGNMVEPAVLTEVKPSMKVFCEEAFSPLVSIMAYEDFKEAVDMVNNSIFGLQCGVFTGDIKKIFYAFEHIETGGVIINDLSTFRADHMPYGGIKESGFGREGLRYAIEEMTELKLLVLNMSI